jgi:hypothetical protein
MNMILEIQYDSRSLAREVDALLARHHMARILWALLRSGIARRPAHRVIHDQDLSAHLRRDIGLPPAMGSPPRHWR